MKKTLKFFAAAFAVSIVGLLLTSSAEATVSAEYYAPQYWGQPGTNWVTWPQNCSGDAVEFSIRVGNFAIGGDFELNHMVGGSYQDTGGQFAWGNGADVDFTLTHDAASGDFTLSLAGGPSTTWHSGRPGESVQNIFLVAMTKNNESTSEIKNLTLDGAPINETLLSTLKDKPSMRIFGGPFAGFTLQGTINFSWTNPPTNGSMIEDRISLAFSADDIDTDGFGNACDNCPSAVNPDLADEDSDAVGDVCDACPADPTNDEDNDSVCGLSDNCPAVANTDQADCNANGIGDACDAVNPNASEVCDNVDNNCNGSTDENLTQPTTCGVGACAGNTGVETCSAGVWGGDTCDPFAGATSEACDNVDNNCNGSTDENLTQPTTCGVGECAGNTGEKTCTAGVWGGDTCDPFAGSTAEECDTKDNNCDGQIDEGVMTTFFWDSDGDNHGISTITEDACSMPSGFALIGDDCDDSDPNNFPSNSEVCGDGQDNNCDTVAEEGCTALPVESIGGGPFVTIQDAYDKIAYSGTTDIIKMQALEFTEGLLFDDDVEVTLLGGFDEFFSEPATGLTSIRSSGGPTLIIRKGTVTVEYIILL